MKFQRSLFSLLVVLALAMACSLPTPTPDPGGYFPEYTPGAGDCELVVDSPVTAYSRPSLSADVFYTFAAGERVPVTAYTADGWVGFEPGIPQAPNVGVFRLRWVPLGPEVHLEGACGSLALNVGPPANTCFAMIATETTVYAEPDAASAILATLERGEYAELIEWTSGWMKVDLSSGNSGLDALGWIEDTVDLNGHCDGELESTASAPSFTPGAGACELVADDAATAYTRPSLLADVFATLGTGDRYEALAYTADGFVGFDPAYAQAANVGLFRLRWVPLGPDAHLEGGCASLPLVVGPPPGYCFLMVSMDTPVYEEPDTASALLTTLHLEDYAAVIERMPGWVKVDLGIGSPVMANQGWVEESYVNLNGSLCSTVPTSVPPVLTETPAPFAFLPEVSPEKVYFGKSSCGPVEIRFFIKVNNPEDVIRMDLYYRAKNKATGEYPKWAGASMNPTNDGGWLLKVAVIDVPGANTAKESWLQYQFIAVGADEQVIARSEVYWNVDILQCAYRSPN